MKIVFSVISHDRKWLIFQLWLMFSVFLCVFAKHLRVPFESFHMDYNTFGSKPVDSLIYSTVNLQLVEAKMFWRGCLPRKCIYTLEETSVCDSHKKTEQSLNNLLKVVLIGWRIICCGLKVMFECSVKYIYLHTNVWRLGPLLPNGPCSFIFRMQTALMKVHL